VAYMLYERVSMDVVAAFRDRDDAATELESAAGVLAWIEGLRLEPATRAAVREPIVAVEAGLRESLRRRARDAAVAAPEPLSR